MWWVRWSSVRAVSFLSLNFWIMSQKQSPVAILHELSVNTLVRSSFDFVESQEIVDTWLPKSSVIHSLKSSTFLIYTKSLAQGPYQDIKWLRIICTLSLSDLLLKLIYLESVGNLEMLIISIHLFLPNNIFNIMVKMLCSHPLSAYSSNLRSTDLIHSMHR